MSTADQREDGMAVIVKYVVVSHGKDDMIFSTRKEAEAHDKMLDIAEQLYTFLHVADLNIAEDTLEALTLFMAQHRASISTILKGGRLKTPDGSAQRAALPQGKREEASAPEHKSNKASQSALTPKPKAAA
jgi:dsDNA-binding SOS-regulon protein